MMDTSKTDRALQEAAAWFARLKTPSVDRETLDAFFAWRAEPHNRDAFARVEATWRKGEGLEHDPEILRAADDALQRGAAQRLLARKSTPPWRWALAASVCGLVLTGLAVGWWSHDPIYSTSVGQRRHVRLEDGSGVDLDTRTRLKIRYEASQRVVVLERGQALFDVAHDPSRPFIVVAGQTKVQALGTQFDVRKEADAVRVTLLRGKVQVRDQAPLSRSQWTLSPGQQITTGSKVAAPVAVDPAVVTSWTSGRLIFRELPLSEAIAEANRYSPNKIRLDADDAAARIQVSGVFNAGDTEALASAIAELYELEPRHQSNGDILLRRPAP